MVFWFGLFRSKLLLIILAVFFVLFHGR